MHTRQLLMAKARGFTISIEKMNEKDRSRTPAGQYAKDYNQLLAATQKMHPELDGLLPPAVRTYLNYGSEYSAAHFNEIDSYCEQIYQLLSECKDH